MRPNGYVLVVWMAALTAVIGCGSSSSSTSSTPPPTGLSKRVLLTNRTSSTVNLLDAKRDTLTTKTFAATGGSKMVTANGTTAVLSSTAPNLTIIDNTTEVVTFNMALDDQPVDVAITTDGATVFAAERNLGEVRFGTTVDGAVNPNIIHLPSARRLVMSPNGSKLLVFSDPQTQPGLTSFFVIDTASKGVIQVSSPNLDQPFTGVFNGTENQAFILSCGAECGGTGIGANVMLVDFSGVFSSPATPATFSNPTLVQGATSGILSGGNLFVAGTPNPALTGPGAACPLSRCGTLSVLNSTTLALSSAVPITDGLHGKMAVTTTGRIYVGASNCTVDPGSAPNTVRGCLTIFNISTQATTFPQESAFRQDFDVTGLQPISDRNVIYVIQGGELDFFDITADAIASSITVVDIIGNAIDAVQIDP